MKASSRHLYHMLPYSPWPMLASWSVFFMVSGLAFYMHHITYGGYIMLLGWLSMCFSAIFWFSDMIDEATYMGYHTSVVRLGLRLGFMLF